MVNPTVFSGMWVYLTFCTSPATKPEIWPLHVTRKQTIINVIYERRKKKAEKKMRKREKRSDSKRKRFLSVTLLFLNDSSQYGH